MNESYERALNEVSLLKKTLNSEKMSHQNTLQQLQTTYQIIEDMREMLKNEQQKNKALTKEIRVKGSKIQEISREYEEQIMNIKELIERKDSEIKKYTQIKVTDYDMIRFRVISEVQTQHSEQIQHMKKEIQKQEYLYNQSLFENKVLKDKNKQLDKQIEEMKESFRLTEQQSQRKYNAYVNNAYVSLEQQKLSRKQTEKQFQREKDKYQQTIKKYHQQLQTLQVQLMNRFNNKQNHQRNSNLNANNSSLIQLKESQFSVENEKLKRQLKNTTQQLQETNRKHKSQLRQTNKKIDQLEKSLNDSQFHIKQLQTEINDSKTSYQQQAITKCKRQFDKKQRSLKEKYDYELEIKDKEIKKLNKQIQNHKFTQNTQPKFGKDTIDRQEVQKLQRENSQLQAELKRTKLEMNQGKGSERKQEEFQNRQTRAVSVQNFKEKLDAANSQIVSLLKDKIALNEKISRLTKDK